MVGTNRGLLEFQHFTIGPCDARALNMRAFAEAEVGRSAPPGRSRIKLPSRIFSFPKLT